MDYVCQTGHVMDGACIGLGNLLDNNRFETLVDPQEHSFHCLLDVGFCLRSDFEILEDNKRPGAREHRRAYVVDDAGKQLLIEQARDLGNKGYCTSCSRSSQDPRGKLGDKGVRSTVVGTTDGVSGSNGAPPLLTNVRVFHPTVSCAEALAIVSPPPVEEPPMEEPPMEEPTMDEPTMDVDVNAPKEITFPWSIMAYEPLTVNIGDTVTFEWPVGFHDLQLFASEEAFNACDFTNARELSTEKRFSAVMPEGTFYFGCSIGRHCDLGQKIQINAVMPTIVDANATIVDANDTTVEEPVEDDA